MKIPDKLESKRLIIRPLVPEDFEAYFSFIRDYKATQYLSLNQEQRTRRGSKEMFDLIIENYAKENQIFVLAVIRKEDNKYMGSLGLYPVEDSSDWEVFYTLLPDYWGKGYATEATRRILTYAFFELNLDRILAYIFPENEASARVAERLGMKDLGFVPRKKYKREVKVYTLLKSQFFLK